MYKCTVLCLPSVQASVKCTSVQCYVYLLYRPVLAFLADTHTVPRLRKKGLLYDKYFQLLKGSASQLYKLVLKDSPYIQKHSGTNLLPGLVINTYTNVQKNLPRAVSATTRGSQPLVVISKGSLELATAYGSHPLAGFFKSGILIDDETWEKDWHH